MAEETRAATEEAETESDTDPEAENAKEIELEEETEVVVVVETEEIEETVPDADHGVAREVTVATIVAVAIVRIERAKIGPTDPEMSNNRVAFVFW